MILRMIACTAPGGKADPAGVDSHTGDTDNGDDVDTSVARLLAEEVVATAASPAALTTASDKT